MCGVQPGFCRADEEKPLRKQWLGIIRFGCALARQHDADVDEAFGHQIVDRMGHALMHAQRQIWRLTRQAPDDWHSDQCLQRKWHAERDLRYRLLANLVAQHIELAQYRLRAVSQLAARIGRMHAAPRAD